jgi:hypothetical protein
LFGYQITPTVLQAETPWTLSLYWRFLTANQENLHSFVHIFNQGAFIAQHDGSMVEGPYPGIPGELSAYDLRAGTIVVEPHPMPALPTGVYTLHIGLYNWETKERLTATQPGDGQAGNDVSPSSYPSVLTITVRSPAESSD